MIKRCKKRNAMISCSVLQPTSCFGSAKVLGGRLQNPKCPFQGGRSGLWGNVEKRLSEGSCIPCLAGHWVHSRPFSGPVNSPSVLVTSLRVSTASEHQLPSPDPGAASLLFPAGRWQLCPARPPARRSRCRPAAVSAGPRVRAPPAGGHWARSPLAPGQASLTRRGWEQRCWVRAAGGSSGGHSVCTWGAGVQPRPQPLLSRPPAHQLCPCSSAGGRVRGSQWPWRDSGLSLDGQKP